MIFSASEPQITTFPVNTDLTNLQTIHYHILPEGLWVVSVVGLSFVQGSGVAVTAYSINANSAVAFVQVGPDVFSSESAQGAFPEIIPVIFLYQSDGVTTLQVTGACEGASAGTCTRTASTLTAYRIA
jgi:ABC-type thiamin/hydroxymethylpyrimidine transport system permease subunit